MASSEEDEGNTLKFYLYAKDTRSNCFFCIELHFDKEAHTTTLSIKAKDERAAVNLKKYIVDLLLVNDLIAQEQEQE